MPGSPTQKTVRMTTPDAFKNLPEPFETYLTRKSNGRTDSQAEKTGTKVPKTDSAANQGENNRELQERRSSDITVLSLDLDYQSLDSDTLDEVFHDETPKENELQKANQAGYVTTLNTKDMTEQENESKGTVVAESYAAMEAISNESEIMDTSMLKETLPEEPKREWKIQTRNRKNNKTALMLALSQAEKNRSKPDDNRPVTRRTTTQRTYQPPKKIGVKPLTSELLYNWTPNSKQLKNWREEVNSKQRNLGYERPNTWSTHENKNRRSHQSSHQSSQQNVTERYDDMSRQNKHCLEQALGSGRWSEIKKSLKLLECDKHCMTLKLSRQLSQWLEHGVYRAYLRKDHTKERFPISLWPRSERSSRGCATLADPVALLGYLNYPSLDTMLSGISAENLWLRLERVERLRLLREAHGCGLRPYKKH